MRHSGTGWSRLAELCERYMSVEPSDRRKTVVPAAGPPLCRSAIAAVGRITSDAAAAFLICGPGRSIPQPAFKYANSQRWLDDLAGCVVVVYAAQVVAVVAVAAVKKTRNRHKTGGAIVRIVPVRPGYVGTSEDSFQISLFAVCSVLLKLFQVRVYFSLPKILVTPAAALSVGRPRQDFVVVVFIHCAGV